MKLIIVITSWYQKHQKYTLSVVVQDRSQAYVLHNWFTMACKIYLWSISSTFFAPILRTKVCLKPNSKQRKDICTKNLRGKCWWNWNLNEVNDSSNFEWQSPDVMDVENEIPNVWRIFIGKTQNEAQVLNVNFTYRFLHEDYSKKLERFVKRICFFVKWSNF